MSSVASLVALLIAVAADPLVRVEGAVTCPTPDQVAGHLERFLPAGSPDVATDIAQINAVPRGVRVALRRADGTLIGEKSLEREASCAEMAEAIGIVLAMWEWPLRPGLAPQIDAAVPAGDRPQVAGLPSTRLAVSPPSQSEGRWRLETGVGVRGLLPGPQPGVLLEGVVRNRAGGWGARLTLGSAWWRDTALGPGRVSWTRLAAGAGVIHGWSSRRLFLDLHEQLLAGAFLTAGHGYDQTRRPMAFEPGLGLGVRGGVSAGGLVRMWADVAVAWWPVKQSLRVEGLDAVVDASPFEVSVTIGGTFLSSR